MNKIKQKSVVFSVFLLSISKWLVLSLIAGGIVGAATAGFIFALDYFCGVTQKFEYYFVLLPVALMLSGLTVKYLAPDAEGHGTEKAIKAIHENHGKMKIGVVPVKLATTIMTVSFGGSVGKEGPSTQIGAGISSLLSSLFRLNPTDCKRLVICGMSAAFAAVFATPITGAIFALEVLIVGKLDLKNLFPSFIAAITGVFVSRALGLHAEAFAPINLSLSVEHLGALTSNISLAAVAGLFFGVVSIMMIYAVKYAEVLSHKIKIYKPLKGLIGGAAMVALVFIFGKNYLGMGINYFTDVIDGQQAEYYDFLLKIIFTAITLAFCGSGGILTPLMFVGITAGSAFAGLFGLDLQLFAALGLFAVLAGSTNTPLACTIFALELFGADVAILAAVACCISYLVTGNRSVYPTQRITESKINSIVLKGETEIECADTNAEVKYSKWLSAVIGFIRRHKKNSETAKTPESVSATADLSENVSPKANNESTGTNSD